MRFRVKFVIGILLLHLLSGYNLHPVFGSDTGGYSDSYAVVTSKKTYDDLIEVLRGEPVRW
jgi:hypothetical protein